MPKSKSVIPHTEFIAAKLIQDKPVQAHLCIVPSVQSLSAPPIAGPNPHFPTVDVGRGRPAITYLQSFAHPSHHIHHCRGRQSVEYVGPKSVGERNLINGGAL